MPTDKRLARQSKKAIVVEPDKDQLDSTISMAIGLINRKLTSMNNLDPESLDGGELYKLSNSLAGLTRARSEHKKLDTIARESFQQARMEFRQRMKLELERYPDLCEKLIEVADAVHSQLE